MPEPLGFNRVSLGAPYKRSYTVSNGTLSERSISVQRFSDTYAQSITTIGQPGIV